MRGWRKRLCLGLLVAGASLPAAVTCRLPDWIEIEGNHDCCWNIWDCNCGGDEWGFDFNFDADN
jgi:hypothetical protein